MNNTNTKIALTNLGKYNEGELMFKWLQVPFTDSELLFTLKEIGINKEYEEYFISDFETELNFNIGEYQNLEKLNYVIDEIETLDTYDYEKFKVCLDYEGISDNLDYVYDLIYTLDDYIWIDVSSDSDLGHYYIEDAGIYDISSMGNLAHYIDYAAFGRDIRLNEGGQYGIRGYVCKNY